MKNTTKRRCTLVGSTFAQVLPPVVRVGVGSVRIHEKGDTGQEKSLNMVTPSLGSVQPPER